MFSVEFRIKYNPIVTTAAAQSPRTENSIEFDYRTKMYVFKNTNPRTFLLQYDGHRVEARNCREYMQIQCIKHEEILEYQF